MGTKPKFWFDHEELGLCLFKESRQNTGEDWAEKIASELCDLLGLPHARYELATCEGMRGTVSPWFFVPPPSVYARGSVWGKAVWGKTAHFETPEGSLTHGNELLFRYSSSYPAPASSSRYDRSPQQHTLDLIFRVLEELQVMLPLGWTTPPGIVTAADAFVGYVLLDAWIGNTDRHHENWGIVEWNRSPSTPSERYVTRHLAPTYDHAASLGCHVPDEKKDRRLRTTDQSYSVEFYARKARSLFYLAAGDAKPLFTLDAFARAATLYPIAARAWLDKLAGVSREETGTLFDRLPKERATPLEREFAQRMLAYNRDRLLGLRSSL